MTDSLDSLIEESHRWISDRDNKGAKALFDWDKSIVEDFERRSLDELLFDPYFLNLKGNLEKHPYKLYDGVYADITELWAERKKRPVNLAVFLHAIGAGKSFEASVILWLLWYELSMHVNPQQYFGLVDDSIIAIMLMSRSELQARRVMFTFCWDRFQSGFNKDYFPANPKYHREIRIDRNRTCVYGGTSSALSILGYSVYAATVDEANFLEVTEDSKKTAEETYDAGEEMFNALNNRMTSRFMKNGKVPGIIVLLSSAGYPDSFLERKVAEIKAIGEKELNAFWRSRSLWEAKGPRFFDLKSWFEIDLETLVVIKEHKRSGNH